MVRLLGDASPLVAASVSPWGMTEAIKLQDVDLAEARARWDSVGADTSNLSTVQVVIADLGPGASGLGHTIWLDDNAAGWGWFVDATPWNDSEFTSPGIQGEQGHMDLLTAIAYELGHLLGYEHSEDGTMHYMLVAGERHMPTTGVGPRQLAIFDAIFIEEKEEETSDRVAHVLLSDFNLSRFLM